MLQKSVQKLCIRSNQVLQKLGEFKKILNALLA